MKPRLGAIEKYCKGLEPEQKPDNYRSEFMRDRDRILYSRPFRRLSKKTQIFLEGSDDHIRTRLTHTLEVAQIAVTSAKTLSLDRDLTEAVALGHDLGHTPFGHSGEKALNIFACNCDNLRDLAENLDEGHKGFKHNLQSIRVLCELTNLYENIPGLNLTNFTLWGISNHTGEIWTKCAHAAKNEDGLYYCHLKGPLEPKQCNVIDKEPSFYNKYTQFLTQIESDKPAWSFEGILVKWADEIAQRHHDIEDGIIANVIDKKELYSLIKSVLTPFFNRNEINFFNRIKISETDYLVQKLSRIIVGSLNRNLIENTLKNFKRFCNYYSIKTRPDFEKLYPQLDFEQEFTDMNGTLKIGDIVSYVPDLKNADERLQDYLKDRVLHSYPVQRMDGKATFILRQLAKAYLTNPQQLPD